MTRNPLVLLEIAGQARNDDMRNPDFLERPWKV